MLINSYSYSYRRTFTVLHSSQFGGFVVLRWTNGGVENSTEKPKRLINLHVMICNIYCYNTLKKFLIFCILYLEILYACVQRICF